MEESPAWCIVANVVAERAYGPGGALVRRGLRLFHAGAKVHVVDGFGGMGFETLTVVGQVRGRPRFSVVHVQLAHLTNWRVRLIHSPAVLQRIAAVRGGRPGFWLPGTPDVTSEEFRDTLAGVADVFRMRAETTRAAWPAGPAP